jgi:hypothetical protein
VRLLNQATPAHLQIIAFSVKQCARASDQDNACNQVISFTPSKHFVVSKRMQHNVSAAHCCKTCIFYDHR